MYEMLKYEINNRTALITMNRPEQRNAINKQLRDEIIAALADAAENTEVNVVLFAGEGKSFCSGRDVSEVKEMGQRPLTDVFTDYGSLKNLTDVFFKFPKPMIAAVKGHALGLGCSLITYCDLIVAGDKASFGFPEIGMNIVPGIASVHIARIIGRRKLSEMMFLGNRYTAIEALEMGLINTVVEDDNVMEKAMEWANKLAELDPITVTVSKKFIHSLGEGTYDFEAMSSIGIMTMGFANKNKR